ncbi:OmpA family protein [bacterium]|nr:OmpA family protein [bacterium]
MSSFLMRTSIVFLVLLTVSAANADVEQRLRDAETAFTELKQQEAHLLSPRNFKKAKSNLEQAQKNFKLGRNEKASKYLYSAEHAIEAANNVISEARKTLKTAFKARSDADIVRVTYNAPRQFVGADKKFIASLSTFENGKVDKAEETALASEKLYREAELIAIKVIITGTADTMIQVAKKNKSGKFAPSTLKLAMDFEREAEASLDINRYDRENAQLLADEAYYYAAYSNYVSLWARRLRKQHDGYEQTWLSIDEHLTRIGREVNFKAEFNEGLGPPTEGIIEAISKLYARNEKLEADNVVLRGLLDKSQSELAVLNEKMRTELEAALAELERWKAEYGSLKGEFMSEMERKKLEEEIRLEQEQRMKRFRELLTDEEALILIDGRDIIIRLIGLQFASGIHEIPLETYDLLRRTIVALEEYPDKMIVIGGHTDALGKTGSNQLLSERRSRSVHNYLLSNSQKLDPQNISSVGYGESRPIATNETKEGRGQNRRLEIVMKNVVRSVR